MKLKLYLNGLYWKDVNIGKGANYVEMLVFDLPPLYSKDPLALFPSGMSAVFKICHSVVPYHDEEFFGELIDPLFYIDPMRRTLRCHNLNALHKAVEQAGSPEYLSVPVKS